MKKYQNLLRDILKNGIVKSKERTGTGTLAVFGRSLRFNLAEGFPLLTTKKMFFRGIVAELLWMISGSQNIRPLVLENVNIWNEWPFQMWLEKTNQARDFQKKSFEWNRKLAFFIDQIKRDKNFADEWGNLGEVYGYKWRYWKGSNGKVVDQLNEVIYNLKNNPDCRRMIVTAWDPSVIDEVALPPCHLLYQFFAGNGQLSLQMYQRSVDTFLGLPFNIASYALLLILIAQVTNYKPGELIVVLGDTHLYLDHIEQANIQIKRKPYPLPEVKINPNIGNIYNVTDNDVTLSDYLHHPAIAAEISV